MSKSNQILPRRRQTEFRFKTPYRPKGLGEPVILEDDEKLELLERVREGDSVAIDRMIIAHIRLALMIVNRHLHNCPHYAHDLDSVVMLGIVSCVHRVANGAMPEHNNITGFILQYIHGLIQREIGKSRIVSTPRSVPSIVTTNYGMSGYRTNVGDGVALVDLRDALEHLAENRREQRILELRGQGYTDHEAGEILGISQWTVRRIRLELYRRFQHQQKEENK